MKEETQNTLDILDLKKRYHIVGTFGDSLSSIVCLTAAVGIFILTGSVIFTVLLAAVTLGYIMKFCRNIDNYQKTCELISEMGTIESLDFISRLLRAI